MSNIDKVLEELRNLKSEGASLLEIGQGDKYSLGGFAPLYETWYTKVLSAVTQIIPERLSEFKEAYRHEKRKSVTFDTYAICDFLLGLQVTRGGEKVINDKSAFAVKLLRQIGIVTAAKEFAPSTLRDIRITLRAELLDADLNAARNLLSAGHLRSSGVVCGVVLETHLRSICDRRGIKFVKKDPSIGDLNDLLKNEKIYDIPIWRLIQRLADIRNICGHRKERDPTRDEVDDLISGTGKVTKEVV